MRLLQSLRVTKDAFIHKTLKDLPRDLNGTYTRIFYSIDKSLISKASLALKWIALAKRPLFIEELVEVCAFEGGSFPYFEPNNERFNSYNVFELLQDLVIIKPHLDFDHVHERVSPRTHTVTMSHVSLIEYLISRPSSARDNHIPGFTLEEGHYSIASNCLSYLFHFNTVPTGQQDKHVLLEYAWYNWEKHIVVPGMVENQGRVRRKAMELYQSLKFWCKPVLQLETQHAHGTASLGLHTMLKHLDWLPHHKLYTMVHVLAKPYFHDNIKDFLAEPVARGKAFNPLETPMSIRLLETLPCLDREEPVLCRLQSTRIENQPEFEALSYVWGNKNSEQNVHVNGFEQPITQNLVNILATLRAQEQGQTPWLWVDALCINMMNLKERNHQITLMKHIYTSAKEVILCMDDEEKEDKEGIQLLMRVGAADFSPDRLYRDTLTIAEMTGVEKIFRRKFWHRAWTVQEFVLARHGTMLAGSYSIPIGVIEKAFQRLIDSPNVDSQLWRLFVASPELDRARNYIMARKRFHEHGFIHLPELLCWFRHQECRRPEDRIYSMIGLLPSDSRILDQLTPDYKKSYFHVCLDSAILSLEHYGALSVLSHVDDFHGEGGVPTWLPTYSHQRIPFTSCESEGKIFNAGGKCSPRLQIKRERFWAKVRVAGCEIDSVSSIEKVFPRRRKVTDWETFLAGQSFYGHRLSQGAIPGLVVPPTTGEEEEALLQSEEFKSWPNFRRDRRFFITSLGHLGLGPRYIRPGDSVMIFAGGPTPYVLRHVPTGEDDDVEEDGWQFKCCGHGYNSCYTFVGEW
jgi:hypothetical protein